MATFGSSDAPDFELPDEDVYIFQVTDITDPEIVPNKFYKEGEPDSKRERSKVVITCTIFKAVSGDEEWAGAAVKHFSNSKPGNELGRAEYPTKLRTLAEAVLNRKIQDGETIDTSDILNGYFQATVVHNNGWANILTPVPYKAQGTGQGGRKRQAPPPPPPMDEEFDAADFDDAEMAS